MQQLLELEKASTQMTNLLVGWTEIPKWSGQTYQIWKNEMERWIVNDKSSDETKYCNVLESLKKNDAVKEYAIGQIVERTEILRTVKSILDVMD